MNDTRLKSPPFRPHRRSGSARLAAAVALVLGAVGLWALNWGCADPRKQPISPVEPGYTETVDLWNQTPTDANGVATATFTVAQQLAPINVPGQDSPARLAVAVFIVPDCQIYRRLQIMNDSIPFIRDSLIIQTLVRMTAFKTDSVPTDTATIGQIARLEGLLGNLTDTLSIIPSPTDSATQFTYHGRVTQCDSALLRFIPNPAVGTYIDSVLNVMQTGFAAISPTLAQYELQIAHDVLDTTRMGKELVYLNTLLDTRYNMSVALDSTNTFYVPNAVYTDASGHLSGQEIYTAALDTVHNVIGRGFTLPLDRLPAADLSHLGHTFEVNWAVCFPGSSAPCLSPGQHTIYVRIPGRGAKVTGTIVLVYAQRT